MRMWTFLVILLILWVAASVTGFLIEGLFWLAIVGIALFVVTILFGIIRGRGRRTTP